MNNKEDQIQNIELPCHQRSGSSFHSHLLSLGAVRFEICKCEIPVQELRVQ